MSLRERKREQTRQNIVDAGFELFIEHGYDDTTVEMIAEEAFVSPRTVYRYFSSKDAIVWSVMEGEVDRLLRAVRKHCAAGVTMRCLVGAFAEQFAERQKDRQFSALARLLNDSPELTGRTDQRRRQLVRDVSDVIADLEGSTAPGLREVAMAATVVTLGSVGIAVWTWGGQKEDLSEMVLIAGRAVADSWD